MEDDDILIPAGVRRSGAGLRKLREKGAPEGATFSVDRSRGEDNDLLKLSLTARGGPRAAARLAKYCAIAWDFAEQDCAKGRREGDVQPTCEARSRAVGDAADALLVVFVPGRYGRTIFSYWRRRFSTMGLEEV